jgi:hypothetical protein
MRTRQVFLCLTVVAITLVFAGSSSAEITNCTPITSLPVVISTQGIYCLAGNLSTAMPYGIAIEITANNVMLDLNGWKVGNQAAGMANNAYGVFSSAINVTVRNGIFRGFMYGVSLSGHGARVEDLLVDQNTFRGITVAGQGSIVRRNQVVDTGGSTYSTNVSALGIVVNGKGSVIEDNLVSGLTATGNAEESAILLTYIADQSVVRRNVLIDDARPTGGGISYGIRVEAASDVITVENNVINFDNGIIYNIATGTFSQNVVVNCTTKYFGGTTGSDND